MYSCKHPSVALLLSKRRRSRGLGSFFVSKFSFLTKDWVMNESDAPQSIKAVIADCFGKESVYLFPHLYKRIEKNLRNCACVIGDQRCTYSDRLLFSRIGIGDSKTSFNDRRRMGNRRRSMRKTIFFAFLSKHTFNLCFSITLSFIVARNNLIF